MAEPKEMGAVPEGQKQGWGQFLKSVASFSGDLSALTAPSFILSPVSLTEYPSYWGEHPRLFAACAHGNDDIEKMVNVLRWFIGTLKGQYTARNTSMGSEKKPLNPILGELFLGKWPDADVGETTLTAEQVSHHPPVTAYLLHNKKAGVTLEGHSGQKTSFSGKSIQVKQVGHAILRVANTHGAEDLYLITLPNVVIEGLWYGAPYLELFGFNHIVSSTGYLATINYTGKGYFSGKAHSFKACVSPLNQPTSALYSIEGDWAGKSFFKGKSPDRSSGSLFWDANTERRKVQVSPIEDQGPLESRRVWMTVADGIKKQDYDTASRDKSRIENEQREKRKRELSTAQPHQLEYFVHVDDDKEYAELVAKVKGGYPARQQSYRRKPRMH